MPAGPLVVGIDDTLERRRGRRIRAKGVYHDAVRSSEMRTTMDRVARRLAADTFLRVRRTALINTCSVAKIERYGKGTYVVHLRSGAQVITGRFYQVGLRRLLEFGA